MSNAETLTYALHDGHKVIYSTHIVDEDGPFGDPFDLTRALKRFIRSEYPNSWVQTIVVETNDDGDGYRGYAIIGG